jgi:hypothetical protein
MNRRAFLRNAALGVAAVPVVALAKEKPAAQPAMRYISDIPREAGAVNCMTIFDGHLFIGCTNGLWVMSLPEAKK